MSGLEAALEELYGVDVSEFTKTRDRLIKQLKATGDKEGAASLGARRKPSQVAWVLNQFARREPDAVSALVDVGRELAREQRKALRGEASTGLRDSIERQRKTIVEATTKVTALMKELGVEPGAHLGEVTTALQAALVDPVVGAQLEEGRLEKAPEAATGFGGAIPEEAAPVAAEKTPERDEAAEKARQAARAEHAKQVAAAKAICKEADAAAKRTRKKADEAEAEAKALIELATRLAKEAHEKDVAAAAAQKALEKLEANAPA